MGYKRYNKIYKSKRQIIQGIIRLKIPQEREYTYSAFKKYQNKKLTGTLKNQ